MTFKHPNLMLPNGYIKNDNKKRVKVIITFTIVILTMIIVAILNIKGVN